jgi:NAD(P)-dependent dehydrogenase (short-subunit alcohol dehydrogenase family)
VDFTDRPVLVTGGTGALGAAVVSALIQAGATCHVPSRDGRGPKGLGEHARLKMVPSGDLADEAAVNALYSAVGDVWASVHLAGGFAYADIGATSVEELRRQIDINFVSCFLCCRAAVAVMKRGGKGGRIVNVAARPALEPRTGLHMTAYTAAKAAVAALTAALAEEVAGDGILVNAVAPSIIDTPANRKDMPKADTSRWPKPEEIAHTILFLASPANAVTRGAIVPVYGKS